MKKINQLLDRLENLSKNNDQSSIITEPFALLIKGGKVFTNNACHGSFNNECNNNACTNTTNNVCNDSCD
jgi:hypothetical protein